MKEEWIDTGIKYATDYGLRIIAAIIIWVVGSWIIKKTSKLY